MADKSTVKTFLQELKQLIKVWGIFFSNRPKNSIQHLADLSITAKMREEIILNLAIEDYSEGPLEETQQGGTEMWVFGKTIKGHQIYIKLTISKTSERPICISFHKAEYPIGFPLQN